MTANALEPHLIESISESAREVFETMVFLSPSSVNALVEESSSPSEAVGLLSFTGTKNGTFVVRCRRAIAKTMAAKMLMMEPAELTDQEEVVDAFGEIVNMLAGSFKNAWVEGGNTMELSVPCVVLDGEVNARGKVPGVRSGIRIVLEGEPVEIGVHFER